MIKKLLLDQDLMEGELVTHGEKHLEGVG